MRGRGRWLAVVLGACVAMVGGASAAGRLLMPRTPILAYSSAYDIWMADLARGVSRPLTRDGSRFLDDSPSWSPDGTRLVYTTVRSFPFNPNLPNGEIALINMDGRSFRLLTRERSWDDDPAWSPDGTHIAFRSNRSGESGTAVFLIDLAAPQDAPRQMIADHLRSDLAPSWSADGARLVLHLTIGSALQVVAVDAVTGAAETIFARAAYDPRPSPDGERIAMWLPVFEGYTLAVGTLDGSPRGMTEPYMNPAPYTWSPDGQSIAFASTVDAVSVVKLLDIATGAITVAFSSPARVSGIAWRP